MTWRDLPAVDERGLYRAVVTEGTQRRRQRAARRRNTLAGMAIVALAAIGVTAIANIGGGDNRANQSAPTTAAAAATTAAGTIAAAAPETTVPAAETTAAGGAATTAEAPATAAPTTAAGGETTAPGPLGLSVTPPLLWETPPPGVASCGPDTAVVRYRHPTAITRATLTFAVNGTEGAEPMDVAGTQATLDLGPFTAATTASDSVAIRLGVEGVDADGTRFAFDGSLPLRNCPLTG